MAYEHVRKLMTIPGAFSSGTNLNGYGAIEIHLYKDPSTKKLYLMFSTPVLSSNVTITSIELKSTASNVTYTSGSSFKGYIDAKFGVYIEINPDYGSELKIGMGSGGSGGPLIEVIARDLYSNTTTIHYTGSSWLTGFTPTNENLWNAPPTISDSDTNMGQKTEPFTYNYTVNDTNSTDNLTITEKANGVTIRTITNAVRGQTYTADLSSVWKQMPVNTTTTLTITVSDGTVSTTRTITFTRKEDRVVAYFKQASLTPESVQPEQVLVRVIRTIATNADFKVFVCNNGLDTSPTWEDATSAVLAGEAYTFTNRMKTAENYAVNVKIQVLKNTASAYSYIKALGFSYI